MSASNGSRRLELLANAALFVSSLLLLLDVAPRDFLPSHRHRTNAVRQLRDQRNILGGVPANVRIVPEGGGMNFTRDDQAFIALTGLIRERSVQSASVDWARAVGVGYSVLSVPVGDNTLEAIKPLYVAMVPRGGGTRMSLVPVGQLEDLDGWLSEQRQGSLTFWALVLLTVGFFLQLWPAAYAAMVDVRRRIQRFTDAV